MDIVGPFPLTEAGNKYILSLQDDLTRFWQVYAIPDHEAETIAKVLTNNFLCRFSIPKIILTDQGPEFVSKLMAEIARLFKIKKIQTTPYRPESNGALERSHSVLADYLKSYVNANQTDWDLWLPTAVLMYNTTKHSSTGFTPYELVFGRKPELPSSITSTPEFRYTYDTYLEELKFRLQNSHQLARDKLIDSKERSKKYFDKKPNVKEREFKVGEFVLLRNEAIKPRHSKKLSSYYKGPYEIISIDIPQNVTLKIGKRLARVHKNRLKRYFPPQ